MQPLCLTPMWNVKLRDSGVKGVLARAYQGATQNTKQNAPRHWAARLLCHSRSQRSVSPAAARLSSTTWTFCHLTAQRRDLGFSPGAPYLQATAETAPQVTDNPHTAGRASTTDPTLAALSPVRRRRKAFMGSL